MTIENEVVNYKTALQLIDENIQPMATQKVELEKSINRVLATDVFVEVDYPPFDLSLYDGYAVKYNELDRQAIESFTFINTGERIPESMDFVVPSEYAKVNKNGFLETQNAKYFKHLNTILKKGDELKKGEKIFGKGKRLKEKDIMLLRNAGVEVVEVYQTPIIALIPTGVELRKEIPESNSLFINLYLKKLGFQVSKFDVVPDSVSLLSSVFENASSCSAIITTGGTAKGKRDVLRKFMEDNCEVLFQKTNLKPGKSALFGLYDKIPVFCLPGTPSACFSTFFTYALYGLRKMVSLDEKPFKARLNQFLSTKGYARFFISKFYGGYIEILENSFFRDLILANSYLVVEEGKTLDKDAMVEFWLF